MNKKPSSEKPSSVRLPKIYHIWGWLLIGTLSYANFYGIRMLDLVFGRTVERSGAPRSALYHK